MGILLYAHLQEAMPEKKHALGTAVGGILRSIVLMPRRAGRSKAYRLRLLI